MKERGVILLGLGYGLILIGCNRFIIIYIGKCVFKENINIFNLIIIREC